MILSNLLLNVYIYSHRFVLLPTFVKGSCSVLGGNGECRNTFPWLFRVLRIHNCEYSTSHGASLSPPHPSQGSENIVRKNRRAGGQAGVLWNAAFFRHNMAATHTNSEKRWLPTYYWHNIKPGKNLIMQWGGAATLLAAGAGRFTFFFVLFCF